MYSNLGKDYEAVCRSGIDYRHASITLARTASASVIQVCSLQIPANV